MKYSESFSFFEKVQAFLLVSRANLLITSFGHATLGMILGATMILDLIQLNVLLYIFLHYGIAIFACNINTFYDYHIDRHYKTTLSCSVDIVGKTRLKALMIMECLLSLILAGWFFVQGYQLVSFLSILGLLAAFSYSAEPVRFKRRGVLGPVLILFLYSLPILGGWFLFQSEFTWVIGIFLIGYILMNEGFTLVNMCEDYDEDRKEHIITWAHRLGIRRTIQIAFLFSVTGLLCIVALLMKMEFMFTSLMDGVTGLALVFTTVLIFKASVEVYEILGFSDLKKASKQYGGRLQRWFFMTRYPLIVCGILVLI